MTIKAVILDVSDTLIQQDGSPVPSIPEMLKTLAAAGLLLVAAINESTAYGMKRLSDAGMLEHLHAVVTKEEAGRSKGSPVWVEKFVEYAEVRPNEMVYLGDTKEDMITATRGPMIYFHANWGKPQDYPYGIPASDPLWFQNVVMRILARKHAWSWTLFDNEGIHLPVSVRALLLAGRNQVEPLQATLVSLLKSDYDTRLSGSMTLRSFVNLSLLGSLFHDDLFQMDYWTSMPGHRGALDKTLEPTLDLAAKLSRKKYIPDLFIRTKDADRSNYAHQQGQFDEAMKNQLETLAINAKPSVIGKRVLVLDNYLTYGSTFEAARNLLYAAGASEVVSVAVGNYPSRISIWNIDPKSIVLDGNRQFIPSTWNNPEIGYAGTWNSEAAEELIESWRLYRNDEQ